MREKQKHMAAFEQYFNLGDGRNFEKLADILPVSCTAIKTWAKNFCWKARIHSRDVDNAIAIAKQSDESIVTTKIFYRRDIRNSLKIVQAAILSVIDPVTGKLKIKVKTPSDLNALAAAYEKLAKLDLVLTGVGEDIREVSTEETISVSLKREIRKNITYEVAKPATNDSP